MSVNFARASLANRTKAESGLASRHRIYAGESSMGLPWRIASHSTLV